MSIHINSLEREKKSKQECNIACNVSVLQWWAEGRVFSWSPISA